MTADNRCTDGAIDGKRPAATIYFDGGCPLCRREIAHYRRLRGADRLRWVDIGHAETRLPADGPSRAEAMARMHVRDASGNWHTGAWAFAEMWSHLPVYRRLAGFLRATRTLPVLDRAYTVFANWRLKQRCDSAACGAATLGQPESVNGQPPTTRSERFDKLSQAEGERRCA